MSVKKLPKRNTRVTFQSRALYPTNLRTHRGGKMSPEFVNCKTLELLHLKKTPVTDLYELQLWSIDI